MIPFAAVLVAGGQSRRMGRDKALLPLLDGRLLWQRQLDLLRALEPSELFISGPAREGFPLDVPTLQDAIPGLGPLGGITSALKATSHSRLLVLAVDLPQMTTSFLRGLLVVARDAQTAVVPYHHASGFYEPLAALYPSSCLNLAQTNLQAGNLVLQNFVKSLPNLHRRVITSDEEPFFTNWNEPADVSAPGF